MLQEDKRNNRNGRRWQTKMYGYRHPLEVEGIVEEAEVEVEAVEEVIASVVKEHLDDLGNRICMFSWKK